MNPMKKKQIIIANEVGLHARPATLFINECKKYSSNIRIRNINTDSPWTNAKSILGILSLGVQKNQAIELEITGDDEDLAIQGIQNLVENDF